MKQEVIALSVVFFAAAGFILRFTQRYVAPSLSVWLLQKGKVKLAMKLRKWTLKRSGCNECR